MFNFQYKCALGKVHVSTLAFLTFQLFKLVTLNFTALSRFIVLNSHFYVP